ncbi:MAG TPA: methyltransferase domain-containing protein [Phycisphaerales bacterium]|nr:methyltransferase domain-containing protein [Phycisphaerales bacterium]
MNATQNKFLFLGKFVASPKTIGAIAPSGSVLAEQMVRLGGVETSRTVLELGPGTGVFTAAICRHLPSDAHLITIEANPHLALLLRKKMPAVRTVAGSAEHLDRIMKSYRLAQADSIISGLPFATFEPALQDRILYAVRQALRPGSTFVTFSYLHARPLSKAKRFRDKLAQLFADVETSPIIWKNLPPAFIYRCRKPE